MGRSSFAGVLTRRRRSAHSRNFTLRSREYRASNIVTALRGAHHLGDLDDVNFSRLQKLISVHPKQVPSLKGDQPCLAVTNRSIPRNRIAKPITSPKATSSAASPTRRPSAGHG